MTRTKKMEPSQSFADSGHPLDPTSVAAAVSADTTASKTPGGNSTKTKDHYADADKDGPLL